MVRASDRSELKRAVLTAPLWMQSTKGSSRQIAETVGVSQSFVARTWRELTEPDRSVEAVRALLGEQHMVLVGFAVGTAGSCLVLNPVRAARVRFAAGLSIISKRRVRGILAADLLRSAPSASGAGNPDRELWDLLASNGHRLDEAIVLVSGDFAVPPGLEPAVRVPDAWLWQKLVAALDMLPEVPTGEHLADLEWRIRRWYHGGRTPFSWTVDRKHTTSAEARLMDAAEPWTVLAEDVLAAIRQGLVDGTFSGESEISLGKLSRLLGAPVRDVRSAIRALTEDGLVTAARSDSVVVRIPTLDDVTETYMARRALGAIVVRAASRWSPEARVRVLKHLEELEDSVRRNDVARAHHLDMDFQIALFESSGLNRIPAIMETLTKQAFMHFAVLGARYTFSPKKILEQNTAIFEAIDAADLRAATMSWQAKMEDGLSYLAQHIKAMDQQRSAEQQTPETAASWPHNAP
ncbi:GntR family transcriptional regulator [Paenarthrobacter sp. NPDC090522]|uniref:GntR family transcriptional regulator n=1 Tax=Paenarthrobacter sp. NPDC090522 TaxID=3364383 RepID=UPI003804C1BF